MSVSINPGAIAFILIFLDANSLTVAFVNPITPPYAPNAKAATILYHQLFLKLILQEYLQNHLLYELIPS